MGQLCQGRGDNAARAAGKRDDAAATIGAK